MERNSLRAPRVYDNATQLGSLLRASNDEIEVARYRPDDLSVRFLKKLTSFDGKCFPAYGGFLSMYEIAMSDFVYVARKTPGFEVVGMALMSRRRAGSYWASGSVAKTERGKGIYPALSYLRIKEGLAMGASTIYLETQNANVEYSVEKALAMLVNDGSINGYSIRRRISKGLYSGVVAGPARLDSSSERINSKYARLERKKGDGFRLTIAIRQPAKTEE
jgi:hypothetical protein